ncbi:hypothetical protein [Hydrogenophaga sp.]|uniref:hypothetical protein n=1 Tax=Hydrogenophaga sp. TaxID=1904254 RepID=UPI002719E846|nr:hypothetical protein [Hydrogenophaga sp.]MDO9434964.1 hypothetical protein [Hydrogenophaga sp.]
MKTGIWMGACVVACLAAPVWAACDGAAKTLFSCDTKAGKKIELCDNGKTIGYAFGRPSAPPELALNVPRAKATTFQWEGFGRYENYSVNVPNGKTTYSVFWSRDKNSPRQAVESGVNVLVGGKEIATVQCVPASVVNQLVGVDLPRE